MDSVVTAALAKALEKLAKSGRDSLEPGTHRVDAEVTVTVRGTVKVGEDEEYSPTVGIPLKVAMALFMRYSGATGPNAMKALIRAMSEAMEIGRLPELQKAAKLAAIREVADLAEAEETVRERLGELPKATRKGRVQAKVKLESVVVSETAKVG